MDEIMSVRGMARFALKSIVGGARMLKVGDPAPEFEAQDHRGNRVKLSDLRGKKVVLFIWGSW